MSETGKNCGGVYLNSLCSADECISIVWLAQASPVNLHVIIRAEAYRTRLMTGHTQQKERHNATGWLNGRGEKQRDPTPHNHQFHYHAVHLIRHHRKNHVPNYYSTKSACLSVCISAKSIRKSLPQAELPTSRCSRRVIFDWEYSINSPLSSNNRINPFLR